MAAVTARGKWLEIFVDIVTYELDHSTDGQLLSEACDVWIDRYPPAKWLITAAGLLLTAHLANWIDPRYDMFSTHFVLWQKSTKAI